MRSKRAVDLIIEFMQAYAEPDGYYYLGLGYLHKMICITQRVIARDVVKEIVKRLIRQGKIIKDDYPYDDMQYAHPVTKPRPRYRVINKNIDNYGGHFKRFRAHK